MLAALQKAIRYTFTRTSTLTEALTHRSFGSPHNERLEFVGDGVLNCVIALTLYERFPNVPEGQLSRLRANLVSREPLERIARRIGLGDFIRLGEGELRSGGRDRSSILADAMEAVIGAVMRDGGFDAARSVVNELFESELADLDVHDTKDSKTALQEILQGERLPRPSYDVVDIHGAQHDQTFVVRCIIASHGVDVTGEGVTRRAAEQAAAREALTRLRGTRKSVKA